MAVTKEFSQNVYHLSVADDYRLMIEEVLPRLGWDNPEAAGVPALEQVETAIKSAREVASWLVDGTRHGIEDQLLIVPTVGGRNGIGFRNLINRLHPGFFQYDVVNEDLWSRATNEGSPYNNCVGHDNAGPMGLASTWDVAVLLGDTVDPISKDKLFDNGLVYAGKTIPEQLETFEAEEETLAQRGIEIVTATVGHMAVDDVSLKEQGIPARQGITRFLHYPLVPYHDTSAFLGVGRERGIMHFSGGDTHTATENSGVRRAVRIPIEAAKA